MIRDLLPIGTVVKLVDGEKPLMVFGIKQLDVEEPDREYDYIGVIYPEGHIGEGLQFLFNHEDIAEVLFKGYDTAEYREFLELIAEAYGE